MPLVKIFILILFATDAFSSTPVVLWHGIGDDHLVSIKKLIRENVGEDVYIKSIQMGQNAMQDFENGIFVHPSVQIAEACEEIVADDELRNGFHAIGFSQGSQFL